MKLTLENGYPSPQPAQAAEPANDAPAQQPAPSPAPVDPMDWPLPCDVTVGHGTMCKGVPLSTLVLRMKLLYEMATGNNADDVANRTPEQNTALADAFRTRVAAVRKHDEQLIRQMVEALGYVEDAGPAGSGWKSDKLEKLIAAARARLGEKQ